MKNKIVLSLVGLSLICVNLNSMPPRVDWAAVKQEGYERRARREQARRENAHIQQRATPSDTENKSTILHIAIAAGKLGDVEFLVGLAPENINAKDKNGNTPAHIAALKGYTDTVKYLVQNAPQILNEQNNDGNTLLHIAATGNLELVKFLVDEQRADITMQNNSGRTPKQQATIVIANQRDRLTTVETYEGSEAVEKRLEILEKIENYLKQAEGVLQRLSLNRFAPLLDE